MRLGVRAPDLLVDVTRSLPATIEDAAGRRPADRRGACATATSPPTRASASATRCSRRRCSRAPPASCATSRRSAATCSSARAARTSRTSTKPCNKREPGSGCPAREGDHRNLAILGHSPACVATHPSDMAVALAALDAVVHVHGPRARATIPMRELHRLPGDEPRARHRARARRADHAVDLPALPVAARSRYRKVRDRASYAFALVSVAAALEVDGRRGARRAHRARRRRPQAVARDARGGRAARRPATERRFARRGRRRARAAPSRCATTPSRSPLARNADRRHAARPAWRPMSTPRARSARDSAASTARAKVTGAAQVRLRVPGRRTPPTLCACSRRSPRARSPRVDAAAALRRAGRARRAHARERAAAAEVDDRELAVLQSPRRRLPRAGRRACVVAETPRGRARGRRAWCAIEYARARPHDVGARAPTTRGCYTPEAVNAGVRDRHARAATSRRRFARRRGPARRDVHARRRSTTTRWSRTRRSRSGTDGDAHALRLQPGRTRRARRDGAGCSGSSPSRCG